MSEFQVLHAEPRHKVEDFVDEVLGRWQLVEAELHGELLRLIRHLAQAVLNLADRTPVRFQETTWLENGRLMLRLAPDFSHNSAGREPHQLDRYVNAALEAWPEATAQLRREIADLLRGLVTQLGVIAKHNPAVRLRRIAFGVPKAWGDNVLFVQILHEDRPFGPREARWN